MAAGGPRHPIQSSLGGFRRGPRLISPEWSWWYIRGSSEYAAGAKQTRLPRGKQERGKVWFSSAELVMEETPKLGKRQETIEVIAFFLSLVRAPYQGRWGDLRSSGLVAMTVVLCEDTKPPGWAHFALCHTFIHPGTRQKIPRNKGRCPC